MIPPVRRRRKLAATAVLAFAAGGLVLSWVSAHPTPLEPITISAPAIKVAGRRDTPTKDPLRKIKITAHVELHPVTLTTKG